MPSPLAELNRRMRIGLILEVDGFPVRYWAGISAPSAGVVPSPYLAHPGLYAYAPNGQKLDERAVVIEGGGAHVNILITRTNRADELLAYEPPLSATLVQAIPKVAGAVDVFVAEDISGWPSAGVIWVGQEAMAYNAVDTGAKSFSVTTRGYYGTRLQRHRVDVEGGLLPEVGSACTRWNSRRARIKVYRISPAGEWLGGVVDEECTIDGSPQEPNGDGVIEVSLAPLSALLRSSVGGAATATTMSELHPFDGETAGFVVRGERWDAGQAYDERVANDGVNVPTVETVSYRAHQEVFDTSNQDRAGPVLIGGQGPVTVVDASYAGDADAGGFDVAENVTYSANSRVTNAATALSHVANIVTPGVPEALSLRDVLARINAAWSPGTTQGATGAWANATITWSDPDANNGPSIRFRVNSDHHPGKLTSVLLMAGGANCTLVDMADPESSLIPLRAQPDASVSQWTPRVGLLSSRKSSGPEDVVPIRTLCTAAWQPGEKWIWLQDDVIPDPDGRAVYLRATFKNLAGRPAEALVRVGAVYPADDVFPGLPGYLVETYEPERRDPPPITWRVGDDAPVVRQAATWWRQPPTRVILDLLLSDEGDGVNHPTYDRFQGVGLKLTTLDVDVDSMESLALPAGPVSTVDVDIRDAVNVTTLISPWLRASRAALVDKVHTPSGTRRLALVPIGPAARANAVATISQGLWLQAPRPSSFVSDFMVNSMIVKADFDPSSKEFRSETLIPHRASMAEHGTKEVTEELQGVYLSGVTPADRRAELLPWALETFVEHGRASRRIRGRIPYADGAALFCGAVVLLDDCPARSERGVVVGVSGPARIVEMGRKAHEGYVELLMAYNAKDDSIRGYAPALKALEVIDDFTLRIDPTAWVDELHPVTGEPQLALDYWAVGYKCQAIPKGNFGAKVDTEIEAIVGDEVTLADEHGFDPAELGRIRPRRYQDAEAEHQGFAFLAGDDGLVGFGGASAPGRRYG